ncbi:MAG: peroxiredoxin family protein [Bacteroidota bacterium]
MSNSLEEDLKQQLDKFNATSSEEKKATYARAFKLIEDSGIIDNAKNVGDKAPDFTLNDQLGKPVNLFQKLKEGPIVLMWYRGGWCPYCNITLHHMKAHLSDFQKYGASLVALTPELPDQSLNTIEKHQLKFTVLSDIGNDAARKYGVVFKLMKEIADIYQNSFGLHEVNGDKSEELPLAVTYVIDHEGIIRYAFLHHDYRVRANPEDIIETLRKLSH